MHLPPRICSHADMRPGAVFGRVPTTGTALRQRELDGTMLLPSTSHLVVFIYGDTVVPHAIGVSNRHGVCILPPRICSHAAVRPGAVVGRVPTTDPEVLERQLDGTMLVPSIYSSSLSLVLCGAARPSRAQ